MTLSSSSPPPKIAIFIIVTDTTLLPAELRDTALSDVAHRFGQEFAEGVGTLGPGEWSGPIESPYGVHLVRVESRTEKRVPPLAEVREAVLRDWQNARSDAALEASYQALRARYQVVIAPLPGGSASDAATR